MDRRNLSAHIAMALMATPMGAMKQLVVLVSRLGKLGRILRGFLYLGPNQATTCNSVLPTSFSSHLGDPCGAPEGVSLSDAGVPLHDIPTGNTPPPHLAQYVG